MSGRLKIAFSAVPPVGEPPNQVAVSGGKLTPGFTSWPASKPALIAQSSLDVRNPERLSVIEQAERAVGLKLGLTKVSDVIHTNGNAAIWIGPAKKHVVHGTNILTLPTTEIQHRVDAYLIAGDYATKLESYDSKDLLKYAQEFQRGVPAQSAWNAFSNPLANKVAQEYSQAWLALHQTYNSRQPQIQIDLGSSALVRGLTPAVKNAALQMGIIPNDSNNSLQVPDNEFGGKAYAFMRFAADKVIGGTDTTPIRSRIPGASEAFYRGVDEGVAQIRLDGGASIVSSVWGAAVGGKAVATKLQTNYYVNKGITPRVAIRTVFGGLVNKVETAVTLNRVNNEKRPRDAAENPAYRPGQFEVTVVQRGVRRDGKLVQQNQNSVRSAGSNRDASTESLGTGATKPGTTAGAGNNQGGNIGGLGASGARTGTNQESGSGSIGPALANNLLNPSTASKNDQLYPADLNSPVGRVMAQAMANAQGNQNTVARLKFGAHVPFADGGKIEHVGHGNVKFTLPNGKHMTIPFDPVTGKFSLPGAAAKLIGNQNNNTTNNNAGKAGADARLSQLDNQDQRVIADNMWPKDLVGLKVANDILRKNGNLEVDGQLKNARQFLKDGNMWAASLNEDGSVRLGIIEINGQRYLLVPGSNQPGKAWTSTKITTKPDGSLNLSGPISELTKNKNTTNTNTNATDSQGLGGTSKAAKPFSEGIYPSEVNLAEAIGKATKAKADPTTDSALLIAQYLKDGNTESSIKKLADTGVPTPIKNDAGVPIVIAQVADGVLKIQASRPDKTPFGPTISIKVNPDGSYTLHPKLETAANPATPSTSAELAAAKQRLLNQLQTPFGNQGSTGPDSLPKSYSAENLYQGKKPQDQWVADINAGKPTAVQLQQLINAWNTPESLKQIADNTQKYGYSKIQTNDRSVQGVAVFVPTTTGNVYWFIPTDAKGVPNGKGIAIGEISPGGKLAMPAGSVPGTTTTNNNTAKGPIQPVGTKVDATRVLATDPTAQALIAIEAAKLNPAILQSQPLGKQFPFTGLPGWEVRLTRVQGNGRWELEVSLKKGDEIYKTRLGYDTASGRFKDAEVSPAVRDARNPPSDGRNPNGNGPVTIPQAGTKEELFTAIAGKKFEDQLKLVKDWINRQVDNTQIQALIVQLKQSPAGKKIADDPTIAGSPQGVAHTRIVEKNKAKTLAAEVYAGGLKPQGNLNAQDRKQDEPNLNPQKAYEALGKPKTLKVTSSGLEFDLEALQKLGRMRIYQRLKDSMEAVDMNQLINAFAIGGAGSVYNVAPNLPLDWLADFMVLTYGLKNRSEWHDLQHLFGKVTNSNGGSYNTSNSGESEGQVTILRDLQQPTIGESRSFYSDIKISPDADGRLQVQISPVTRKAIEDRFETIYKNRETSFTAAFKRNGDPQLKFAIDETLGEGFYLVLLRQDFQNTSPTDIFIKALSARGLLPTIPDPQLIADLRNYWDLKLNASNSLIYSYHETLEAFERDLGLSDDNNEYRAVLKRREEYEATREAYKDKFAQSVIKLLSQAAAQEFMKIPKEALREQFLRGIGLSAGLRALRGFPTPENTNFTDTWLAPIPLGGNTTEFGDVIDITTQLLNRMNGLAAGGAH